MWSGSIIVIQKYEPENFLDNFLYQPLMRSLRGPCSYGSKPNRKVGHLDMMVETTSWENNKKRSSASYWVIAASFWGPRGPCNHWPRIDVPWARQGRHFATASAETPSRTEYLTRTSLRKHITCYRWSWEATETYIKAMCAVKNFNQVGL